jgi:hypothetical protein
VLRNLVGRFPTKKELEGIDVDGKIIGNGGLQKAGEMVRTEINWLRIQTSGGLL